MATIEGTEGTDVLYDTSGNDSISAKGGDDVVAAYYGGNDGVDGGAGRDLLVFNMTRDFSGINNRGDFTMLLSQGGATINGSASWQANFLSFINFEDITIYFSDSYNRVSYNDVVNTGDGNDAMYDDVGGNDQFNLGGGIDQLEYTFTGAGPAVMAIASIDAAGVNGSGTATGSGLTFTGVDVFRLTGTAQGDTLFGGNWGDTLKGLGGNDSLRGLEGDDVIYGDAGNDLILGDGGNDSIGGGDGDDEIHGGAGNDTLGGHAGTDILMGEDGDDYLYEGETSYGGAGFDRIYGGYAYGGDGDDLLYNGVLNGEAGNDQLWLEGSGIANGGAGNDRLRIALPSIGFEYDGVSTVTFEVDPNGGYMGSYAGPGGLANRHIDFSGIEAFSIVGTYGDQSVRTGDGNDAFAMGKDNDTVDARGGEDVLDGGTGADTLIGGTGNDTYYVDDAGDQVIEQAGEGTDTVITMPNYAVFSLSAFANVENLTGSATTGLRLTGNALDNVITGASGSDALIGLGGHDTLAGGAGNDGYILDDGLDTIVEAAGGGNDTVYTTASYTLNAGAEVETLTVYDRATGNAINFNGNEFGQTIYGNAGNNFIDGKGGSDAIYLMGGADTVVFTTPLGAGNVDAVVGFASGDDKLMLDSVTFAGLGSSLPASAFVIGSAAGDADDRIVYDQASGQLYFDADGNGAGAAVLFATLGAGTALAASDFVVI